MHAGSLVCARLLAHTIDKKKERYVMTWVVVAASVCAVGTGGPLLLPVVDMRSVLEQSLDSQAQDPRSDGTECTAACNVGEFTPTEQSRLEELLAKNGILATRRGERMVLCEFAECWSRLPPTWLRSGFGLMSVCSSVASFLL